MSANTFINLEENISGYSNNGKPVTGHITIGMPGRVKLYVDNLKDSETNNYVCYLMSKSQNKAVRLGELTKPSQNKQSTFKIDLKDIGGKGLVRQDIDGVAVVIEGVSIGNTQIVLTGFGGATYSPSPLIQRALPKPANADETRYKRENTGKYVETTKVEKTLTPKESVAVDKNNKVLNTASPASNIQGAINEVDKILGINQADKKIEDIIVQGADVAIKEIDNNTDMIVNDIKKAIALEVENQEKDGNMKVLDVKHLIEEGIQKKIKYLLESNQSNELTELIGKVVKELVCDGKLVCDPPPDANKKIIDDPTIMPASKTSPMMHIPGMSSVEEQILMHVKQMADKLENFENKSVNAGFKLDDIISISEKIENLVKTLNLSMPTPALQHEVNVEPVVMPATDLTAVEAMDSLKIAKPVASGATPMTSSEIVKPIAPAATPMAPLEMAKPAATPMTPLEMAKPTTPAATPMTTTSPEIMPDIPAANPEMVQITPLVKPERVQTTPLVKPEISGINLEDIIEFTNLIKGLIGDKSKSNDKKVDFQEILNIVSAVTKSDQTSENTTIDPKVVENANEIIRDLVSQKPVSAGANAENADCGCDKSGKTVDEQFSEAMNFLIKTFQNKKDVEPKEGDVGFLKDQINAKSGLDKKAEIETLIQTTLNKDNKKVDIELENLLKRIEAFKKANHMNAMQPKTERPEKIVGKYENNPVVIKDNNKTIEPHINIAVVPIEVGNIGIGDNKTINVEDNALVKKNLI